MAAVRSRKFQGFGVAAVATLLLATLSPNQAAADSEPPEISYNIGVSSADPPPATIPAGSVDESGGLVTLAADTPDGFKLIKPGIRRSDWVYDSDNWFHATYKCTVGGCDLLASVKVQLWQYVNGGTSHAWQLNLTMSKDKNPGGLTWSRFATYWCGVNVKDANDYTCGNGAAPSNQNMSIGTTVHKPWGSRNNITVFPMVQASTQFSNGVKMTTKFRGYDTLSRASNNRLNTTSGKG